MMKNKFIESGKFVGTHGVRGTLRVQPWCDTPQFLCKFKSVYLKENGEYSALKILSSKVHGNIVLMDIDGVNSIESADKLRNKILYISRKDIKLDNGQYLICDLMGCKVFEKDTDKLLGEISDVSKTGANDVWHIKSADKEYLIPVIPSVVSSVDIDAEKIIITPLAGIFDDIEEIKEEKNAD
jgi:16S rRNA processing protein RimM